MSAHTPAPWVIEDQGMFKRRISAREGKQTIHRTAQSENATDLEELENDRLIAAAPDMLAACVAALDAIDPRLPGATVPLEDWAQGAANTLRAAIARAQGGAS